MERLKRVPGRIKNNSAKVSPESSEDRRKSIGKIVRNNKKIKTESTIYESPKTYSNYKSSMQNSQYVPTKLSAFCQSLKKSACTN